MSQAQSLAKAKILIVDDLPDNLRLLSTTLTQEGFDVRSAINGSLAIMGIESDSPDLILLDIGMPDMDGFEVCDRLKSDAKISDIPIIFISALDDVQDKVKAFELGGVDYITKPFIIAEVLARIYLQLELKDLKHQLKTQNQQLKDTLQQQKQVESQIRQLNQELERRVLERTQQLQTANEKLKQEMQERQQAQAKLLHMATYDPLTGLANRPLLLQHLEETVQKLESLPNLRCLLLRLDCDRIKTISNTLGHDQGDRMLIEIANHITATVPQGSFVAQLGGDEFAIVLTHQEHGNSIDMLVELLHYRLSAPIHLDNLEISINPTIGMVVAKSSAVKAEYLLRDAELAMVQAKQNQRGSRQLFQPAMHQQALQNLELEGQLRQAIEQNQLKVYYQPIVLLRPDTANASIVGYEALARWQPDATSRFIPPGIFIPLAEETGLITQLGDWVFKTACQQLRQWNQQRPPDQVLCLSVNFSIHQLNCEQCFHKICNILQFTQVPPEWIKLEITESVLMKTPQLVLTMLEQLRGQGIQISIDDFGTGYSSLNYLKQLPIDTLKVDRTFIQDMEISSDSLQILKAILNLAQALKLDVIAEGIETATQAQTLADLGCLYGQGYWFSKPLDSQAAGALLESKI
ncbi:MAG: EAL domain-containing protein [Leptolyngbyaceae cyanobacterium MAG.088]|nr:EAL domain-containing protein [Leptolyngbyaceae cyanobacterium MAG.088]